MKVSEVRDGGIYKTTICARCGEVLFSEYLGTDDLDGGFTKIDKFEARPSNWRYTDMGILCPNCAALFQAQIESFMKYSEDI